MMLHLRTFAAHMEFLQQLNLKADNAGTSTGSKQLTGKGEIIKSYSPVDGKLVGSVQATTKEDYNTVLQTAEKAFLEWRKWPAPKRGDIVRQFGEALRKYKEPLGKLVSYEMGKSLQEGWGEVQEMIDICDFAVGLSRAVIWLNHAQRKAGPSHVRAMAPAGCCRNYFCI